MDKKELKELLKSVLKEESEEESKEVKEEVKEEPKKEDEEVEKMAKKLGADIKSYITEGLREVKATKEAEEKASKVVESDHKIDVREYKQALYTKKDGTHLEITKSVADDVNAWYKSVLQRDFKGAAEKGSEMNSKYGYMVKGGLEPLNQSTNADGGFLVPTILADFIVQIRDDVSSIRPNAFPVDMTNMKTNTFDIPKELGRPKVEWAGVEQVSADKSTTSATYENQTLTPYTLAAIVAITNQLVEDSPFNMPQIIARQFGDSIAREEDRVFIQGTGTNQPTGLDSYTAGTIVAAGGNLTFDHLTAAYWGLPQAHRDQSFWIMNSSRIGLVQNLKDSNNRPLFIPALTTGSPPMLAGRPVLENNNMSNANIYLCDLSQYFIAFKNGIRISTSGEANIADVSMFERNMTAIRAEERLDAELVQTRALAQITNP